MSYPVLFLYFFVYFNVTFDSKKISKLSCWTCFSILQVWRIYYIPVRPWNKFRVTLCLEISWLKLLQQWLAWLSALNVPTCFATQKHFALCRQSAFLALIYSIFALFLHHSCTQKLLSGFSSLWLASFPLFETTVNCFYFSWVIKLW